MDRPGGYFDGVRPPVAPFATADEVPGSFDLLQGGGDLYLVARFKDPRYRPIPAPESGPAPSSLGPEYRVVDVRQYGGQTAGRSAGYLPDGPAGTWTPGLRPTRGAPNALARLGL